MREERESEREFCCGRNNSWQHKYYVQRIKTIPSMTKCPSYFWKKKLKSELFYLYITLYISYYYFSKSYFINLSTDFGPRLLLAWKRYKTLITITCRDEKKTTTTGLKDKFILTCSAFRSSSSKVAFFSPSFICSRLGITTDVGLFPLLSPGAWRRFPSRTAFSLNETKKTKLRSDKRSEYILQETRGGNYWFY